MKDQHTLIKGYRDLTEAEIAMMNKVKELAAQCGELTDEIRNLPGTDQRWLSIGVTDLQKGFMGVTRAIAKPTSF